VRLFGFDVTLATRAPSGLSAVSDRRGSWWPIVREPYTGAWQRNDEWTTDTVLAHHAVYACITRISQDIGKLRPKLVERDENGIWTETENAAHSPVLRRPNRFQNHIQFKEWWATSKLSRGNTYVLLERDQRGVVIAQYVLDPNRVQVLVSPDGAVFYELQADNIAGLQEDKVAVPASEIIHDRMNCLYHPLVGTSPIFACGTAANLGLQIQSNSSSFFANGSNPSGILSTVTPITPEQAAQMSDQWNARFGASGPGGVAVLGFGLKFEAMRMSAADSQTIEQLKWTAETVCSTFHVPPWKVGIGEQPAYTKPEIANHAYYSDCLQSHIEQWELCMDRALGVDETKVEGRWLGVELDLDGLLRMDADSQVETLSKGVGGSLYTVNEARKKLDQKPVPGGDSIWMQQQNYSLEALQERDKNDPFAKPEPPQLPAPEPQKQLMAGEPEEEQRSAVVEVRAEPVVVEDDHADLWAGWLARDALALVREAQAQQQSATDSLERNQFAEFSASTRAAIETLTATVQTLAARETVVHVEAPQVHVAPVNHPPITVALTLEPRTVTKEIVFTNDEHGVPSGASITETTG
jgi:HK97 family phage portal protein